MRTGECVSPYCLLFVLARLNNPSWSSREVMHKMVAGRSGTVILQEALLLNKFVLQMLEKYLRGSIDSAAERRQRAVSVKAPRREALRAIASPARARRGK